MRAEDIRKAVKPYIPGWVAEQISAYVYPEYWLGYLGLFQMYNAAGSRVAMINSVTISGSGFSSGMQSYATTGNCNNGDYYVCDIPLKAGTYSWRMSFRRGTDSGKFDLYVGATKVNGATPKDFYYASNDHNQPWDVDSIVIAADGVYTWKILNVGKNGSSSDYTCYGSTISINRTA